ncbi:IclR family transcriptional regulator domain-containing protein [Streptomyces sp. SP18CS02]|uniref:IclR family transcriptional regulator domain-containing protein n=1 Tax=Streptomyces sp. SP18CS02 TaxID=3002531 RepID=UPI002E78EE75|nr:IclR family transcriptional regulator C-terminal domain-containing protein [Streptomyces sp. SP18CS02]MEE1752860.1 IclR family transcriptional regulator C-terminal domain-containing protein [Streptomyces sp. SP18CS02]
MTDVSRFNQDDGGSAPLFEAGLRQLRDQLAGVRHQLTGTPHFWDRPDGDFGPLTAAYGRERAVRERANSLFRLGSRALGRGELATAADWLGEAAEAGHPGALFRMAAVALRATADWGEEVKFLVAEAARHGHGDARRLLAATAHRRPAPGTAIREVEDPEYFDEIRAGLDVEEEMLLPAEAEAVLSDAAGRRLVLVPAPVLPGPAGAGLSTLLGQGGGGERPHLSSLNGGRRGVVIEPLPDPAPYLAAAAAGAAAAARADAPAPAADGEVPWSADALRPAVLTDMARSHSLPAQPPAQLATAVRARDLLIHIQTAAGTTTRDLARRTGMSVTATSWLLHWLRTQFFIETVAGVHYPGSVLEMAMNADRHSSLMQQTLDGLRDRLRAAVYLSTYTGGEISILQSSHSASAPPVRIGAPFTDTGHASAVGKAHLAGLDFDGRMEHLARYQPVPLTPRTITSPRLLFDNLDRHGPNALQFDLLEYSERNVCAAFSLTLPGQDSGCVAFALPTGQRHRLIPTAAALSEASTGLLVVRLLSAAATTAMPSTSAWPREAGEGRAIALS